MWHVRSTRQQLVAGQQLVTGKQLVTGEQLVAGEQLELNSRPDDRAQHIDVTGSAQLVR